MSGKNRWYACAVLALSLLVPGLSFAQDNPVPVPDLFEVAPTDAPAAECAAPLALPAEGAANELSVTLEELKKNFGAKNMCGARCGSGFPSCSVSCGYAAICRQGFCLDA